MASPVKDPALQTLMQVDYVIIYRYATAGKINSLVRHLSKVY